jgi:hypothetical protein
VTRDYIYIRFRFENYGYQAGDIIKVQLNKRDGKGVHVTMWSPLSRGYINAWSDLGSFYELSGLEVIVLAAEGILKLGK